MDHPIINIIQKLARDYRIDTIFLKPTDSGDLKLSLNGYWHFKHAYPYTSSAIGELDNLVNKAAERCGYYVVEYYKPTSLWLENNVRNVRIANTYIIKAKGNEMSESLSEALETIKKLETENTQFKAGYENLKGIHKDLLRTTKDRLDEITKLKGMIEGYQQETNRYDSEVRDKNRIISELSKDIDRHLREIADSRYEVHVLEQQLHKPSSEEISKLKDEITKYQQDMNRYDLELADKTKECKLRIMENSKLQLENTQLKKKLDECGEQKSISTTKSVNASYIWSKKLDASMAKVDALRVYIDCLEKEVDGYKSTQREQSEMIGKQSAEIVRLKSENSGETMRVDGYQKLIDTMKAEFRVFLEWVDVYVHASWEFVATVPGVCVVGGIGYTAYELREKLQFDIQKLMKKYAVEYESSEDRPWMDDDDDANEDDEDDDEM